MPNTEKYTVYECQIPGCTEESENEGFCNGYVRLCYFNLFLTFYE